VDKGNNLYYGFIGQWVLRLRKLKDLDEEIKRNIKLALTEDMGAGDLTASLIPDEVVLTANIVCREHAILCGTQWFDACFEALQPALQINWFVKDGDAIKPAQKLCTVNGNARILLSAERPALNFLQMLSAVSTQTRRFVDAVAGTNVAIVDTRKTLPGLRRAQKYAVKCGGGVNHRLGLYDGILIKENHIMAAGGIDSALKKAQQVALPDMFIQIEVESLQELQAALTAGAKMILLDNFTLDQLRDAVKLTRQQSGEPVILEASGNITLENVRQVAQTGIDRISIGSLTKDIKAIDLSMLF